MERTKTLILQLKNEGENETSEFEKIWGKFSKLDMKDQFSFLDKEFPNLPIEIGQKFTLKYLDNDFTNTIFVGNSDYIAKFLRAKEIFLKMANLCGYWCFKEYEDYQNSPWADDILIEAAYFTISEQLNNFLEENIFRGLSAKTKERIQKSNQKRQKNETLAKILIQEQVKGVTLAMNVNHLYAEKMQVDKLLRDPALRNFSKVQLNWIPNRDLNSLLGKQELKNESVKVNLQAVICRNLFFQNLEVSKENIERESKGLLKARERYKNIEIFKGRSVVVLAHPEKMVSEKYLKKTRDEIAQIEDKISHLSSDLSILRNKKRDIKTDEEFSDLGFEKDDLETLLKYRKEEYKKIIEQSKKPAFANAAFTERINFDKPKSFELIRPENNLISLEESKRNALDKISEVNTPFTFVFNGHGENALYLSDGQIPGITDSNEIIETKKTIKITSDELFEAYKKRPLSPNMKPGEKDIFILSSCFNASFIRNFYQKCDEENIPKPIFIGESEFGQFSYSERDSIYNNNFFEGIFPTSQEPAKLGNIIMHDRENQNSNPSFYIPDDQNRTMQISKHETLDQNEMTA